MTSFLNDSLITHANVLYRSEATPFLRLFSIRPVVAVESDYTGKSFAYLIRAVTAVLAEFLFADSLMAVNVVQSLNHECLLAIAFGMQLKICS